MAAAESAATRGDAEYWHWSPELLELVVQAIPRLCRSKVAVLDFFRGAGVADGVLVGFSNQLAQNKDAVSKYHIVRSILGHLNDQGERGLAIRRQVLHRVVEFEDFSTCWPDDQLEAAGLVAKIRSSVDRKDSFTRLQQHQEEERRRYQAERRTREERSAERRRRYQSLLAELTALFPMSDVHERGIALEGLLNKIFAVDGLSIREAFVLRTEDGQPTEQIDGAIELDGSQYVVEVKWWAKPLGKGPVAEHLVRVYGRAEVRGLMISASGFTRPAVDCVNVL